MRTAVANRRRGKKPFNRRGMGSTGFVRKSARYKPRVAANEGRGAVSRTMEQAGSRRLNWPPLLLPSEGLVQNPPIEPTSGSPDAAASAAIYAVAFVTGAIVMSFEMLGSRYLNPYFGSGIYTWAALISTVLIALTAGYFLGGALGDRTVSPALLALTVVIGSVYLLALPCCAPAVLEAVLAAID